MLKRPQRRKPGGPAEDRAARFLPVGMFNSGTNFLHAILEANAMLAKRPSPRDLFKHFPAAVQKEVAAATGCDLSGTIFYVIVRHPVRWVQSVQKTPYELVFKDLRSPCHIKQTAWAYDRRYRQCFEEWFGDGDAMRRHFEAENLLLLWKRFHLGYYQAHQNGALDCEFVTYENLVQNPVYMVQRMLARRQLELDVVAVPTGPAKTHGKSLDYLGAYERLAAPADQDEQIAELTAEFGLDALYALFHRTDMA